MRAATLATLLAATTAVTACAQVGSGVQQVRTRAAAIMAPTCQDFSFPLYFNTGSDQLTREGLEVIENFQPRVRACPVAELKVTGLADAQGDPAANLALSQRRSQAVSAAMSARGYPTPTFDLAAGGDAGARAGGRNEPLRRRAEVSVRFAARAPTR